MASSSTIATTKHHTQRTDGDLADRHASVLLAKDPVELEQGYDKWATRYDADLAVISGLPEGQWCKPAVDVLEKCANPATHPACLDFGCGTGVCGVLLKELGWGHFEDSTLDGCDLSQGMLDVSGAKNCYQNLIKSTSESSGCDAEHYDVVFSWGVFAPGQAPPSAFDEFLRVLKPNGIAVFTARIGYYDGTEGKAHKDHLEELCEQQKWKLLLRSEVDYIPKEDLKCY
ncbi:MAG: hypothetical protein SGARI_001969, partial [Bacillariaceae sp.]